MNFKLPCPNCGQLVDQQELECKHCGVNLALAAVKGEQDIISKINLDSNVPITPEILVPRIGELLIERGVLSPENLQRALDYSQKPGLDGYHRLLGQALLELKLVDQEVLDQVITEQILQLHTALQQSNLKLEQRVKERTQELQAALNKLAELNQLKSNFISNVSHELRTPLTHIRGYLDLMKEGSLGDVSEEQTIALDVMLRAEGRLEELIEKMIEFSMEASGHFTIQTKPADLTQITEQVVQQARWKAEKRPVLLESDLGQGACIVKIDQEKIQWVMMELLENAIKFTPPNGSVKVGLNWTGDVAQFSVLDTGIGIASERLTEIFEPYHQLDSSSTRQYGGIGLGLSLVKKILEAHGSKIEVTSQIGSGTFIEFHLPICNEDV